MRRTVEERVRVGPGGVPGDTGRRAWAWLPAGVVLVVSLLVMRADPTETEDSLPGTGALEATTTTSTTLPFGGDLSRGWAAIDLPGEGGLVEVVSTASGLLAFGTGVEGAFVWRSGDGMRWEPVADPAGVFARAAINAAVPLDDGVLAFGSAKSPGLGGDEITVPAVWRSSAGRGWERVTVESVDADGNGGEIRGADHRNGRVIAVGWSGRPAHGAVWLSDDGGLTWRDARGHADMARPGSELAAVIAGDHGVTAVGSRSARPAVWHSVDGDVWAAPGEGSGWSPYSNVTPTALAPGGAGLVAVGTVLPESPPAAYPVTWLSSDGREWLEVLHTRLGGVLFADLAAAGPGLIAAGTRAGDLEVSPGIWWSSTGAEWEEVLLDGSRIGVGRVRATAVAEGGPGLVVVGELDGGPEVWVWAESDRPIQGTGWERPDPGHWVVVGDFPSPELASTTTWIGDRLIGFARFRVWWSSDGLEWQSAPMSDVGLTAARWIPQPAIVHGRLYVIGVGSSGAGLWASDDLGRSFDRLPLPVDGSLYFPNPSLRDELLLAEAGTEGTTRLLRSEDGEDWNELPPPGVDWIASMEPVPGGYVATGWSEKAGSGAWVFDGRGWGPVELPGAGLGDLRVFRVGGTFVALSTAFSGTDPVTQVLTSSDGASWEPTAVRWEGWAQPLPAGAGYVVVVYPVDERAVHLWSTTDGEAWLELDSFPAAVDYGLTVVSDRQRIRAAVWRSDGSTTLVEWVPPAG